MDRFPPGLGKTNNKVILQFRKKEKLDLKFYSGISGKHAMTKKSADPNAVNKYVDSGFIE